jgi:hypothetical protein
MQTADTHLPPLLLAEIKSQSERNVPADTSALTDELKSRFGESLRAILLYGSCMRSRDLSEGVVDLYAIVDNYKNAYKQRHLQYMNAWLPPNVFYLECGMEDRKIRSKFAVLSIEDFQSGCHTWFHSYVWSRFAQPIRLIYADHANTSDLVYRSLAHAVIKFLDSTLPALGSGRVDTQTIWVNGLTLTYAAELRPEQNQARARLITEQNFGDFYRLTEYASPALPERLSAMPEGYYQLLTDNRCRQHSLKQWRLRRWLGLVLSVLRLIKAAFTFRDAVDYAAWKIKRHTGIAINVTPALRRHPVIFGFSVLWQLLRRGTIR